MCQLAAEQTRADYRSQTRSLRLNGQSTSIRLEGMFWRTLDQIAKSENLSTPRFISKLHSDVMGLYGEASNFTSLLRCTCLVHAEQQQSDHTAPPSNWNADETEPCQAAPSQ